MPSTEYDLRFLQAGIPLLEEYLLSDNLYWSVGVSSPAGEPAFPQMTIGQLLLARARLHARSLSPEQRDLLARLDEEMDSIRARWRVAWGKKTAHEFRARLNLWRDFLEEYRQNPNSNLDRYAYEVRRRVMLHYLKDEAEGLTVQEEDLLKGLDSLLQKSLQPGDFVWNSGLSAGFPREPFWYLYGQLKSEQQA